MNRMNNFLNLFVTILLFASGWGICYLQAKDMHSFWTLGIIPVFIMMILWGIKIQSDYKN